MASLQSPIDLTKAIGSSINVVNQARGGGNGLQLQGLSSSGKFKYNFRLKPTVISVYKDTLYKDNLGKIWPKPTLFDFGPSLYKDNLGKNNQKGIFS
jgi:hypothetical protein